MDRPKCPICQQSLGSKFPQEKANQPLVAYSHCRFCKMMKLIILGTALIFSIIIFLTGIVPNFGVEGDLSKFANLLGLSLNMWGAYFLATGYLEEIFVASAIIGGQEKLEIARKNAPLGRLGVILLVLGFFLMAIAQIIR